MLVVLYCVGVMVNSYVYSYAWRIVHGDWFVFARQEAEINTLLHCATKISVLRCILKIYVQNKVAHYNIGYPILSYITLYF